MNAADDNSCIAKSISNKNLEGRKIKNITLLGAETKVEWVLSKKGLSMKVNSQKKPLYSTVWRIELK